MFRQRTAIGNQGYPFVLSQRLYEPGLCPVAERLYEQEIIGLEPCAWEFSANDAEKIVEAFTKVHAARNELGRWQADNTRQVV